MLDAAHGMSVGTVVGIERIHDARSEFQTARVEIAGGVGGGRPRIPVRTGTRQDSRRAVADARSRALVSNHFRECRKERFSN